MKDGGAFAARRAPTPGRHGTTATRSAGAQGGGRRGPKVEPSTFLHPFKEITMPIILWLLGVPLSVVLLLMLFGVF
ncbi:hypothetical protein GmRootA79_15420 [Acidovorax sp. A79]